jgi:hypothetical protein
MATATATRDGRARGERGYGRWTRGGGGRRRRDRGRPEMNFVVVGLVWWAPHLR